MAYLPDNNALVLAVPPWIQSHCRGLSALMERDQGPQALLIHGPAGSGRRFLGFWYAAALLGVPGGRFARLAEDALDADEAEPELAHPDLLLVTPPPEKKAIGVDSVRRLIDFLHLKSHQGGARVALIFPADAMTPSAANSLLKTLEEPPAASAIILVATAAASLPATVLSRCHRVRVSVPSREVARPWLEQEAGPENWDLLLDFAGGAPLRAKALHKAGFAAKAIGYAEDLRRLRLRNETPVAVAMRWARADTEALLRWLYLQAAASVGEASARTTEKLATEAGNRRLQSRSKPLNMHSRIERLRDVDDLYRNRAKPMNLEIQFAAVLQRWYGDAGDEG